VCVGGTDVSPVQAMYDPEGRILTWQGHPEFDVATMNEVWARVVGNGVVRWPKGVDEAAAREELTRPTTEVFVALCVARFIGL